VGSLQSTLEHIKNHTEYPSSSQALIAACNNMSEVQIDDKSWFETNLPSGTYDSPEDVVVAVMAKL